MTREESTPSSGATVNPTTDEWIIGDGVDGTRRYLVHLRRPRFIACMVEFDPSTKAAHGRCADVRPDGAIYRVELETALGEPQWIDPAPAGNDLARLMEGASNAVECWERRR